MTPVAISRAASLKSHARHLGVKQSEFVLLLTVQEGFELIDWLLSDEGPMDLYRPVLEADAAVARAEGNPWVVLDNFHLDGFEIRRRVPELESPSAMLN